MSEGSSSTATLIQVAQMYYNENRSQQEIAAQLGVSRSLIALFLKRAREQNIVRIEIADPQDLREDLAARIKYKTGLHSVTIIPGTSNPELNRRTLGGALARHLEHTLRDGQVLGYSWGRTLLEAANLLAPSRPRRIEVVPLLGESSFTSSYTQMNQTVQQIAHSFGGQPYFLLAPLVVGTPELRDALLNDEVARPVVERWNQLDVACVGIGTLPPAPGQVIYLGEENVRCFLEEDGVGDICARYFTRSGKVLDCPLNQRMIGISLEQLRQARAVVAIAGGAEKSRALTGALRAGLAPDLIIDDTLAQAALEEL